MKIFRYLFLGLITLNSHGLNAADIVFTYDVFTLTFEAGKVPENPYLAIPVDGEQDFLSVRFTGETGDARGIELELVGFWDGGNTWNVNFAAPAAGKWSYRSSSPDRKMNNKKGTIEVLPRNVSDLEENPLRRGHVRVRREGARAGHIFEYADGTPFMWIGDTWWNWTKRGIQMETFRELVDDRSGKGYTVGQLFVPGNGSRESSLLSKDYTELNIEHARKVEEMIRYANSKGIAVWIHGWWSREGINKSIGKEKMMRWQRYLIHRYAAYNVIWTIAGEYNMNGYGGFPLEFWKEFGTFIKEEDPYRHLVSAHNTPPTWGGGADAPQWSTGSVLHAEPWLDYNQCQVGHGRYSNEMIPVVVKEDVARTPAKPIVVTEPWYEFIEGNPTGRDVRLGAWSAVLSGAAGHTYGGGHVWWAHVPESPSHQGVWPLEEGFERTTYDYDGAVSVGVMAKFFNEIDWQQLEPYPELISFYPQPYCLANPGEEYVAYLRYGGNIRIHLGAEAAGEPFEYYWMNPSTGRKYDVQRIEGREVIQLRCPETYPGVKEFKDWVLYLKKASS